MIPPVFLLSSIEALHSLLGIYNGAWRVAYHGETALDGEHRSQLAFRGFMNVDDDHLFSFGI